MSDLISRDGAIEAVWECYRSVYERDIPQNADLAMVDAIQTTLSALPSAEAEWIPCSERLPSEDEFGWYLVTVKGHGLFVDLAPFNDELWKGLASHQEVIAWMPLPKPYREEREVGE